MDNNNKDPGGNLALWLPGGAVIISLVVSTFALTREPFLEARPTGAQFQVEQQIEARLWQDPFDALERHRKKSKDGTGSEFECHATPFDQSTALQDSTTTSGQPRFMVALVPGGPYADEVEMRRRIRYAILAAFKKDGKVPAEEQRIGCLALPPPSEDQKTSSPNTPAKPVGRGESKNNYQAKNAKKSFEIPLETLVTSPLDHPATSNDSDEKPSTTQTILLWVKEEYLTSAEFSKSLKNGGCDQKHNPEISTREQPLQNLETLRCFLALKLKLKLKLKLEEQRKPENLAQAGQNNSNIDPSKWILKVIGPSTSKTLRLMYLEDAKAEAAAKKAEAEAEEEELEQNQYNYPDFSNIEIYSPLATTPKEILVPKEEDPTDKKGSMKLLRTVSDDNTLTIMLLEELKRRGVDPVHGLNCNEGAPAVVGSLCQTSGWGPRASRIALVSEWDSLYSRAFANTFKKHIVQHVGKDSFAKDNVGHWLLQFGYLRGLDGLLPEESASGKKTGDGKESNQRDGSPLDIGSLEKADGNSQLDYLRRLAEHIAERDEAYRRNGESGIGAIGVLGTDAYDKLLVLQALKGRMPNKVFFSTDLDARMLQRGQAETVRNLVLAAPYGLTLTQKLQQDVPPFRESSQSAVFVAVLAALAPQSFEDKRARFDYSDSGLLSPAIYEVGTHGFIPLKSSHANVCQAADRVRWRATSDYDNSKPDIMSLTCLQDEPPLPYPELSDPARARLDSILSMWWAKPLSAILAVLAIFLGWWWMEEKKEKREEGKKNLETDINALPGWICNLPLTLYIAAALSAVCAIWLWHVGFMWMTFLLILLGIILSKSIDNSRNNDTTASTGGELFDSPAYYIAVPIVVFILAIMWAYQYRCDLTEEGLGEPMFLFEGISAWPTLGLHLLALLISISALAWGWRKLHINRTEIEQSYHLDKCSTSLWECFPSIKRDIDNDKKFRQWLVELGDYLFRILIPLSPTSIAKSKATNLQTPSSSDSKSLDIDFKKFWEEHCLCGTFGARLLRAILATWVFAVATSVLYVLWPIEGSPIRGEWKSQIWQLQLLRRSWMVPTLTFQLLVFWVVDANYLLVRFIRQLSRHHMHWPASLRKKHENTFGSSRLFHKKPCIDAWVDMALIAKRTAAVNRLIYAPTVVLLILIMSRSSVFDNWPTPPSVIISYLLTALVLFASALSLRRAAEKARGMALQNIDQYLLETPDSEKGYDKFRLIREQIAALNTGAFSRYTEEPLVRALLLSLAGIGGSAIVEVLNYSKF